MVAEAARDALETLSRALGATPAFADALQANWRSGRFAPAASDLPEEVARAAQQADLELTAWTRSEPGAASCAEAFADSTGEMLFLWCAASVGASEPCLGALLAAAAHDPTFRERTEAVARARAVSGPLEDALACLPLLGRGGRLELPANAEARSRLEILIWEAGAKALSLPELNHFI